jgi:hypothetical protein
MMVVSLFWAAMAPITVCPHIVSPEKAQRARWAGSCRKKLEAQRYGVRLGKSSG